MVVPFGAGIVADNAEDLVEVLLVEADTCGDRGAVNEDVRISPLVVHILQLLLFCTAGSRCVYFDA